MVSAPKKWKRWCGPRSELVRATEMAANELRTWSGLDPTVEVRIEDDTGLTETQPDVAALMDLHPDELRHIASVIVTVRPDREASWKRREEEREKRRERGEAGDDSPPFPKDEVTIRITNYGTTLEVEGEQRTAVEGLRQRLSQALGRGATNVIDRGWVLVLAVPAVTLGVVIAVPIGRAVDLLGPSTDRVEADEIVALVIGLIVPLLVTAAVWWLFPPIEMFDEGGAGRARRFRVWIIGAVVTLSLAVISAFVYDAVTK